MIIFVRYNALMKSRPSVCPRVSRVVTSAERVYWRLFVSVAGLQSRGNGSEELRMTAETCPGADLIRINTLPSPGPQATSARSQHYDPDYAKIEAWLDEHREFAYDYFLR